VNDTGKQQRGHYTDIIPLHQDVDVAGLRTKAEIDTDSVGLWSTTHITRQQRGIVQSTVGPTGAAGGLLVLFRSLCSVVQHAD